MLSQCIKSTKCHFIGLMSHMFSQGNKPSNILGIDFGGTNSVISIIEGAKVRIVENADGARLTPSFITYTKDPLIKHFGNTSKNMSIQQRQSTFYAMKYFYGRQFNDQLIQTIKSRLIFPIIQGENNSITFKDQYDKTHTVASISKDYLIYLKSQAENIIGRKLSQAIISLPRFVNIKGRNELKAIMKECGLNVIKFIDEPIAALYGYQLHHNQQLNNLLVVNIGGMNSSYSFIKKKKGKESDGNGNGNVESGYNIQHELFDFALGGIDFDKELIGYLVERFKKENGIDLMKDSTSLERLTLAAENAKIELSQSGQSLLNLPFIGIDNKGIPKHMNYNVSQGTFETLTDSLTSRIKANCIKFKSELQKTNSSIDDILIVGGITRIPKVQSIIKEIFNKQINKTVNPEEAPSLGCATISSLVDNTSSSSASQDLSFIPNMPLSFGIETLGGKYTTLIRKDESLPLEISKTIITISDNQPRIEIKCYLGERPLAVDNQRIGTLLLGLPLTKRNMIKIQLMIAIQNNGDVTIGAIETLSKKSTTLNTNIIHLLGRESVAEVIEQAKKMKEEDKKKMALVDLKVKVDKFIYDYQMGMDKEKKIKGKKDKKNEEKLMTMVSDITKKIKEIEALLNENDYEKIHLSYILLKKKIEKYYKKAHVNIKH